MAARKNAQFNLRCRSGWRAMKTAIATAARFARYTEGARNALSHIQTARQSGAKNARQIASYLNDHDIAAPTNAHWTESAVLRCLRTLKSLRLDPGSRTPHEARSWGPYRVLKPSPELLRMVQDGAGPQDRRS
jgi:hypothetical protein